MALKTILVSLYLTVQRARARLADSLIASRKTKGGFRTFRAFGFTIVEPENSSYCVMKYTGSLREFDWYKRAVECFCLSEPVILDVGANIGISALSFCRIPGAQVYAFEPVTRTFENLRKNVMCNSIDNIQMFNEGFSDRARYAIGGAKTDLPTASAGSFGILELEHGEAPPGYWEEVCLQTIEDKVSALGLERLDYIKLDIEGWETNALKGGLAVIDKFNPVIQMEIQAANVQNPPFDRGFLSTFVEERDYTIYYVYGGIKPLSNLANLLDDPNASMDIVLVPNKTNDTVGRSVFDRP